ncbi:hypothetical protein L210DRAFT_3640836 [Boletus edulis BED1]|uniref:Uncharacterized protein n=1 Tax=Boletus edulis BED1 TaxID=1328754 RepID=A0AAD4C509_BOLED|nr:hypothetical protein L210DRAFT_3640836 [Boletus edulis BED1]
MSTPNLHPQPSQATSHPFQQPISDEVFHFAPFLTLDHHTISPVYYVIAPDLRSEHHPISHDHSIHPPASPHDPNYPEAQDDLSQPPEGSNGESRDNDVFHHDDEPEEVRHIVPCPRNAREAYLLLEAARADCRILNACKTLAQQIIHRNTLVLQYNRIVLERAQDDLHAADRFVGQVRFWIRKSGQSAAFEYAMQEDHSLPASGCLQP